MTTVIINPFEGGINPGTESGQKLYTLATADRKKEDILLISQEIISDIMPTFRHNSNSFGWGKLVNNIIDNSGTNLHISEDFQMWTLVLVKVQAVKTWHDSAITPKSVFPAVMTQYDINPADALKTQNLATFYRHVQSKMIAKRIDNSLTTASWKTLFSKRKHFTWLHPNNTSSYDGPTMFQILITGVNISTQVRVSNLKTVICSTKLVRF